MGVEDFESPPLDAFWDGVRLGELKPKLAEEWRQRVGINYIRDLASVDRLEEEIQAILSG